jgi:hypothetical protein
MLKISGLFGKVDVSCHSGECFRVHGWAAREEGTGHRGRRLAAQGTGKRRWR